MAAAIRDWIEPEVVRRCRGRADIYPRLVPTSEWEPQLVTPFCLPRGGGSMDPTDRLRYGKTPSSTELSWQPPAGKRPGARRFPSSRSRAGATYLKASEAGPRKTVQCRNR